MVADKPQSPNEGNAEPLPRGRHDLPPEVVERHQRDRIVIAVASVMAERGYGGLTVGRIISGARVSRTTFYNHFTNKQDAVAATHQAIFERFLESVEAACGTEERWPDKVKAGIGATLEFASAWPDQSQLLVAQFNAADMTLARRIRASHDQLASLLGEGRRLYPEAASLPPLTEQALVGAMSAIIARGLIDRDLEQPQALRSELIQLTLTPYLGSDGAAREVGSLD